MESPLSVTRADTSVWTESFKVRSFDADASGQIAVTSLCNFFQEVAGNHARELGVSIEQLRTVHLTWMLSRLHVKIRRYPSIRDTLFVDTWPSGHNGLYATRDFRVFTESGDEIAQATSAWLIIDLNRMRPLRVPDFIEAIPVPELERAIPDTFGKMIPPERTNILKHIEVKYADLDVNQHANNVSFIDWALACLPHDLQHAHQLESLEIDFKGQAKSGDIILSKGRMVTGRNPLTINHVLLGHTNEDKELAVARTRWRLRETT